ncbi:hypothetical protein ACJMQP_20780 [Rhodopseudomonas palustris]
MGRIATGIALMLVAAIWQSPALADKRVALVIGNSGYQNVSRLDNPKNDVALRAAMERDYFTARVSGASLQL